MTVVRMPIKGTVTDITEIPDEVFAKKTMGEGFGITGTPGGEVLAPVAGEVVMVAKTGHAVGITDADGLQFIVHLGLDTVELDGAPFEITVAKGDTVEAGDRLGTMDAAAIEDAGKKTDTVVVIANSKKKLDSLEVDEGPAAAGDEVARAHPKDEETAEGPEKIDDAAASGDSDPGAAATGGAGAAAATDAATGTDGTSASEGRPPELTGHDATAWDIIAGVGGAENIRNVTHCISRVRMYLKDDAKADDDAVGASEGVIETVRAGGQYQVVIGPEVEDVYDAVVARLGGSGDDDAAGAEAEERERPDSVWGWLKWGFSELIGVITGSMIPIIGLLAASGIIKGVLSLLLNFELVDEASPTYAIINAMSDAVFFFLPIFVGYTAAKRLGANPVIVGIIGGVLCYPTLVEMADPENQDPGASTVAGMALNADFFGIPFPLASYSYSIFPVIVAAWLASRLEPWLKKVIPATLRMIFAPLIEVVVVSLAILLVLGPIVMVISTGIASGIQFLYEASPTISGTVIGGLYQGLVIFGLHWAVIPLVAQDLALTGHSYLNAIISATMVAQGGAALGVLVRTKLAQIKTLAAPATISALCSVTEPAMYGINLKYGRVFLMGSIGGACGGLLTGLFNVNMWGFTGSVIGFTSFVNPDGLDSSFWGYLLATGTSLAVAFALTYFFGFRDSDVDKGKEVKKVRLGHREPVQR